MSEHRAGVGEVVEHVFRHEYGKLTSTLARAFGLDRLGIVEDIVQDTLLVALTQWSYQEVPKDPTAWLYSVARNRALDHLRRDKVAAAFAQVVLDESETITELSHDAIDSEIQDSQLRMIFACCHPGISQESQIAIALKTLCGFSVAEIASAFITSEATIEKRLQRARRYFRDHKVKLTAPTGIALQARISTVLECLYLLFNEGYKRSHSDGVLERDLCLEALRLALLVTKSFGEEYPEANALVALMLFHAARFDARVGPDGAIILLSEQDRDRWDPELRARAYDFFVRSDPDSFATHYHIEASIQALHFMAKNFSDTDWSAILALYKRLYALNPNAIVLLHMSVAVCEVFGPEEALALIEGLPLQDYYLYHALRGSMLMRANRKPEAIEALTLAKSLSKNEQESLLLEKKLEALA